MLEKKLEWYFQDPTDAALKVAVDSAKELAVYIHCSSVWRYVVKAAKAHAYQQADILRISAELCGFSDLSTVNLADFVLLDSAAVFSFCYRYFKLDELFCKRLLHCLTDCIAERDDAEQLASLFAVEVTFDELFGLFSYCELAAYFIYADYSKLLYESLKKSLDRFTTDLAKLSHAFCCEFRRRILDFEILHEVAALFGAQMLGDVTEVSYLCINESSLDEKLGKYLYIFYCYPLEALSIKLDATAVLAHLAESNPAAAECCCRSLQVNIDIAIEDSIARVNSANCETELSIFSVLARKHVNARLYVGRLNQALRDGNNLIVRSLFDAEVFCPANALEDLYFDGIERYFADLLRSSCDVEILGSRIRFYAALLLVYSRIWDVQEIEFLPQTLVSAAIDTLLELGIVVREAGRHAQSEQAEVYEIYAGQHLKILQYNSAIQAEAAPQVVKARICKKLKLHGAKSDELEREFGGGALVYLRELEYDCVVEFDYCGVWQLGE